MEGKKSAELYFDYMKCVKDSITNIYRSTINKTLSDRLQNAVYRTNVIVMHTYNFLKLYILYLYAINENLPVT